jgi:hypothetical protein
MMSNVERPQARPRFRGLAAVLAALCFLVAALFVLFLGDGRWFFVGLCLFVGFVMTRVAATGQWPPTRGRGGVAP